MPAKGALAVLCRACISSTGRGSGVEALAVGSLRPRSVGERRVKAGRTPAGCTSMTMK